MPTPSERLEAESWAHRAERELRATVEAQSAELAELKSLLNFYDSARNEPLRIPEWQVHTTKGGHVGLVMAQLTDWHLGEVVKPEEIFDLNAFNREIALQRVKLWAEKVITLPREYVNGVRLDGVVIPATGDLFTGDIHDELKQTNTSPLLAEVLFWQEPVMAAILELEREWTNVAIHAVDGNHGRLSKKPIFKERVHDNVEWLFWSVVRDRLRDLGSKVTINVSPSADLNVSVYGRNHLLTHGEEFQGGTGISGSFAPLMLGSHRKGKRQDIAKMPMETMVLGHLHQLINIPGIIMGGCLKGYDEFAFGHSFPPAEAAQAMWITTPERAQTMWMPVYVQDRAAEGW